MEFISDQISEYAEMHTSPESELLRKINRETHLEVLFPRMLSGQIQGRILSTFSKMVRPEIILEIGTYTGYSALCLAEGLTASGKIITLDKNAELEDRVRGYFNESAFKNQIDFRVGDAMKLVPEIDEQIDLAFIDADKVNYTNYYDLIFNNLASGGFIIADNVLWSGKVVEDNSKLDEDTLALKAFNKKIQEDERVENVLMPVRDGLMVIRKIS